jgi:hypothetical protein
LKKNGGSTSAPAFPRQGLTGEVLGVRQRGTACGGQYALGGDTGRDQGIESGPTLGDRERLTLPSRSKRGDAVYAGREQALRVVCEPCGIERAALIERA